MQFWGGPPIWWKPDAASREVKLSAMELIKKIIHSRQREPLLDCKLVERPNVNHHAQLPTLLLQGENWRTIG